MSDSYLIPALIPLCLVATVAGASPWLFVVAVALNLLALAVTVLHR